MLDLLIIAFILSYFLTSAVLVVTRFKLGMYMIGAFSAVLLLALVLTFLLKSLPALSHYGASLLWKVAWDPIREEYGLLQAVVGTLLTSAIAITLATPLAIAVAVVINELLPRGLQKFVGSLVDLSAAMPTVIYGLWGLFTLGPILSTFFSDVAESLGLEIFVRPYTILTASVLLSIMITPYAAAVIREGYALVPKALEEAIYAVGATRFEAVLMKLKYVRSYILGGLFLALGRAMGETVAVAMVVGGNFVNLTLNPLEPGITISSLIALQFPNAQVYQYMEPVLYASALILASLGVLINVIALYVLRRWT